MQWQELIVGIHLRIAQELERVLDGLTVEDLNQQPRPDCNSIGWLAWHLTRSQDRAIEELAGQEQVWTRYRWYSVFNRPPDPTDTGYGHSPEDVAAFRAPDGKTLFEYHMLVLEETKRYLSTVLSETDLEREFENPAIPRAPTVYARILGVINDNLQHVGQAAYVRGLLKGKGWSDR